MDDGGIDEKEARSLLTVERDLARRFLLSNNAFEELSVLGVDTFAFAHYQVERKILSFDKNHRTAVFHHVEIDISLETLVSYLQNRRQLNTSSEYDIYFVTGRYFRPI